MAKQRTEIVINDEWKVVRENELNWQVYQWREIQKAPGGTESRAGEFKWYASGHYFGQLAPALRWIAEEQINNSGEKYDLMQAVSAIETSNLKLASDIRKALKNASVD